MPTFNVTGWIWSSTGSPTTLLPVTITDDDANLSPYFTDDFTENLTIGGTTYNNPQAGTFELTFTDSGGTSHTEDFLLFYTGSNFIFVPLPGSEFDSGSIVTSLGGWQDWTTGPLWSDVVCFTSGTSILTPTGPKLIDSLAVGDLVLTKDNGIQAIRWIGKKYLSRSELQAAPHLRPVTIKKDAYGAGVPNRDVSFSPQHRILYSDPAASLAFGSRDVLVPAKGLIDGENAVSSALQDVEYIHILFDQHEIVFADGLASESFQPGQMGAKAIGEDACAELFELFPQLQYGLEAYGPSARRCLTVTETQSIVTH